VYRRLDCASDVETGRADGGDVRVPPDERHVVGPREETADETAEAARTEDQDSHGSVVARQSSIQ
jgi:hypothetical protein